MRKNTGRTTRLITPPNIPTFDCDAIVHIERMGDTHLKFYISGPAPVRSHGQMRVAPHIKIATIWSIEKLARAAQQAQAAAATAMLIRPDDDIGEPEGHG